MAIRSTGIRPIERNGLRGFGLTITIDNTNSPDATPVGAKAGEAGSHPSSAASPAPYSPWTVKSGRRV
jgi:hypothetical protein